MRRRVRPSLVRLVRRVRSHVFGDPAPAEVEEELAFHLEMRVRELMAAGVEPEEARRRAEAAFGDMERVRADCVEMAEAREARTMRREWWDEAARDVGFALRQLRLRKGFAAAAILTLGLGIGANTAVFSVVDGVLLRPLPYEEPEELVALWTRYLPSSGMDIPRFPLSPPELYDYGSTTEALEGVVEYVPTTVTLGGDEGDPARVGAALTGPGLFALLGVAPALGRPFREAELAPGAPPAVLLSHRLWTGRFGADPGVLGRTVTLDDRSGTVVGVMPEGFVFPDADAELWTPLGLDPADLGGRAAHWLRGVGRLAPGATLAEARAELETITAGWNEAYAHHAMGHFIFLRDFTDDVVGDARPVLLLLLAAVGLVLLVACGNVANLFLARAEGRAREMAVRTALGAGRARLARQLAWEGLVVAALGGALGVALAAAATPALLAVDPSAVPRADAVGVDLRAFVFTGATVVLATLLFVLAPALRAGRTGPGEALRGEGARIGGSRGGRFRRALIAGQVALSLVVVVAAGLVVRSLRTLRAVDSGVRAEGLLTFSLSLPSARYDATASADFYEGLERGLRGLPGVTAVAGVNRLPLTGTGGRADFRREGEPPPDDGVPRGNLQFLVARPGYFEAMGLPLLAGRGLAPRDDAEAPLALVLSRAAVDRYFPEGDALGRRLTFQPGADDPPWFTVVGVVEDARHALDEAPLPTAYMAQAQVPRGGFGVSRSLTMVVRTAARPEGVAAGARRAVAELDPALPVYALRTMEAVEDRSLARPRLTANLLAGFAVLVLLLAAVGIYGVVSYALGRRTREIGVRLALGCGAGRIARMLLAEGAGPAALGAAAGLALALAGGSLVEGLLFGVGPRDAATLAAVPALLLGVALAASGVPAWRASRIPPTEALREE